MTDADLMEKLDRELDHAPSMVAHDVKDSLGQIAIDILDMQEHHNHLVASHPDMARPMESLFFAIEVAKRISSGIRQLHAGVSYFATNRTRKTSITALVTDLMKQRDAAAREAAREKQASYGVLQQNESLRRAVAVAEQKVAELTQRTALNPEVRARVFEMNDGRCVYCEQDLAMTREGLVGDNPAGLRLFHVDHIVPRSCGGPDHETNFLPSCEPCNIAKGNKHYWEFIKDRNPHLKLVASR